MHSLRNASTVYSVDISLFASPPSFRMAQKKKYKHSTNFLIEWRQCEGERCATIVRSRSWVVHNYTVCRLHLIPESIRSVWLAASAPFQVRNQKTDERACAISLYSVHFSHSQFGINGEREKNESQPFLCRRIRHSLRNIFICSKNNNEWICIKESDRRVSRKLNTLLAHCRRIV